MNQNSPSLKSKPALRVISHQNMYKSPNRMSASSNQDECGGWRVEYKKRCMDEFKKSRQKLICRFRNLNVKNEEEPTKLKDYLQEELKKICILEAKTNKSLISSDEADEIYSQIQQELLTERLIEEYAQMEAMEEEMALNQKSHRSVVVCPVCVKSNLVEDRSSIWCENVSVGACEFKINGHPNGLDLAQLAARLEAACHEHPCLNTPVFMYESSPCCLLMACEQCNFTKSII